MLTYEEAQVLRHLYKRGVVAAEDIQVACSANWSQRVLSQLEWLGCVMVYYSQEGQPLLVEMTQKGIEYLRQAL